MSFNKIKKFFAIICLAFLVSLSTYAQSLNGQTSSVRIGIFNSQKTAQKFFESLPTSLRSNIDVHKLWLNAYESASGLTEYYLDIADLQSGQASGFCNYLEKQDIQCIISRRQLLIFDHSERSIKPNTDTNQDVAQSSSGSIFRPLGLQLHGGSGFDASIPAALTQIEYKGDFSLLPHIEDDIETVAYKENYSTARDQFLEVLQKIGPHLNDDQAFKNTLSALGRETLEAAGSAYLSGLLQRNTREAAILSSDTGSGNSFVDHVKDNLENNTFITVQSIIDDVLAALTGGTDLSDDFLQNKADDFMLNAARNVIDSGLRQARRSDLFALRHLELEYNLNDFENAYFSVLATQPVYQSEDVRHNVFVQGGGIINEKSVDIDDDTSRHTANLGLAYRYLTVDERYLLGGNVFVDHQWPYNHSRMSLGMDAKAEELNFAANYYIPLSGFKDSRIDEAGTQYEEQVLEGYDLELGYTPPALPTLSVFGKGYQYFRETEDNLRGLELSAEYDVRQNMTVKGSVVQENGGRDGVELALQYRIPLYDPEDPNLAVAAVEDKIKNTSMRSKIFEKVRRENRIRVEERIKTGIPDPLSAQFNPLSIGLPFDVGGSLTGSGVDLPFDTAITVPNGDFGIIDFSNGAIANISTSGGGDVILEFNETTLTVTATNGGFVQFISGSGGITTINVPGGTVNLLGTDIDVTDDGTNTTIQVRAGTIEVVPDIGVDVETGNQADIVNLVMATGVTSLLVDPALETRQEAAYTNLDLINPSPPATATAAPFINAAPELITGPQFVGNNADLRLTFTQPVTITGAPFINGFIDANPRTFAYDAAASTPSQPVFRHTYIAGDVGASAITIQGLDLNGGSITSTANGLNALTAFTDTIVAISDLTAPSLLSSVPVDDEPLFSAGSSIVLNFDENVQAGLGNITITDTSDGSDTRIIPIGDAQVSIVGSTVTIDPTGNLDLANDYDLTIPSGVIEDTSGNAFAGIASGELNFTTSNGTVPMFVNVTPPPDGTYTNGQNLDWTLTYDQAVTVTGGPPTIPLTLDTGGVTATYISGSGTANLVFRYTIAGADLDSDGVVLGNMINLAGSTMVDTLSMTQNADLDFTAFNPATANVFVDQPPTLASSTPVDDATGESVGVDVTLTFNENVQAGTGNIVFTDTDDGSGDFTIAVGDARVGIVGAIVTIDLSAQLLDFDTNYEVTAVAGVFEDTGVLNLPHAGLVSGDVNWQTVVDPTAGFPAPTVSMAPSSTSGSHENAQDIGTWQTTIDIGASPDGVIFESGATGQGIAASFGGGNLVFAAGDGSSVATGTDSIFGMYPIASIPQGLHHFVFVADPDAPAEIGMYIDGIRVITESIAGGMQGGEWAGTNGAGYGLVNSSIRLGVDSSALSGATLTNNLSFYTNVAPADF